MVKRLLNKLMMFKAVLSFLKGTGKVWDKVPDTVTDVNGLQALTDEIDLTRQFLNGGNNGKTDQKEKEQTRLIAMAYALSADLAAMAERTGNVMLQAQAQFSPSALENQRDLEQVLTAKEIALLGREYLDALSSSGTTEAQISELEEQIVQVEKYLPAKRVSVAEGKAANDKLKELFQKADRLLKKRLDKMMVRYETTGPDFYKSYLNARIIVDYGIRHEKKEEGEPGEPA
jgi:hypothetical protein